MEITQQQPGRWQWLRSPQIWITLITGFAFYFLIRGFEGLPVALWPNRPMMGQTAFMLVCLTMMGAMWYFHRKPWAYYLLTHLFALGFGAATLLVWQSYPIGPGGLGSDSWFSTAIVTKHRYGMGNTDFAYKGLHTFYPSLYQFVVGTIGAWTVTPGPKAMKYGFYWAAFLLPLVSYGMWRKLLPQLPAFLMMVVAITICRINLSFKTYEVISVIVFVPWALYYIAGLRHTLEEGVSIWTIQTLNRRDWIIGGLIAGLCFMTFYYYFFLLIIWLPLQVFILLRDESAAAIWARFKPMLFMFGLMMVVSAVFWLPLLMDMLQYGMHSYQNRWFQPHMLGLPFDVMGSWKGMLGLVLLLVLAPQNALLKQALVMLIALLGYLLLGHLGVYENFPILHVRMVGLEEYLFHLGMILGAVRLLAYFKLNVEAGWDKAFAIAIAVVYAVNITMMYSYETGNDLSHAAESYRPPALISFPEFNNKANEKVFLTNRLELTALRPTYLFICPNAHYSHPASRYRERLKLLALLQMSKDSDFIAWMLQYNRYNSVDYLILDGNHLDLFDDNFPNLPNHTKVPIQFSEHAFEGQYFQQDTMFSELIKAESVPLALWQDFDQGELRLAALFTDNAEIQAKLSASEFQALKDEIRIQTKDYELWKRVFHARWLQWE